jgi:hypothetical protein
MTRFPRSKAIAEYSPIVSSLSSFHLRSIDQAFNEAVHQHPALETILADRFACAVESSRLARWKDLFERMFRSSVA